MKVSAIDPKDIPLIWDKIKDYLDGSAKYSYGRYKIEDIYDSVVDNYRNQLWVAYNDEKIYGAVITEISDYPRMRVLTMHFTGGVKIKLWKDEMLSTLQNFARDNQCKSIESLGRKGWEKIFKDDGFKSQFMFYELPVEKQK